MIRAGLVGLGAILTVLTLVWMISVRLRDASIADICWGLGFVLLALAKFAGEPDQKVVIELGRFLRPRESLGVLRMARMPGERGEQLASLAAQGLIILRLLCGE